MNMGFYVNPETETKEKFLDRVGEKLSEAPKWDAIPDGKMMVTLLDNGWMTAAGICYSEMEYREHTSASDPRPRTYYLVDLNELIKVGGLDFAEYMCGDS